MLSPAYYLLSIIFCIAIQIKEDPLHSLEAPELVKYSEMKISVQPEFPKYPASARIKKIQGGVLVEVWIDEAGVPQKYKAIWGPKELYDISEKYCSSWRFQPYRKNSKQIPVRFRMLVLFKLNSKFVMPEVPKEFVFM